ncbi:helix-turn-helix domain-containing protein [Streptomyces sp. NPDC056149]|uniref:helix-turn-helix domain-containing protein n=1 Tax=Streptomyces sp. NPDC056149 TaxID=3345728 RepID=UPI0035DEF75C
MPVRQFDGRRCFAARRAANLTQTQLGKALGLSKTPISEWEASKSSPPPERFPAIADVLGQSLDALFPRLGEPDLRDLRCDAGFTQAQAAEQMGISRLPLGNAESGKRKLNDAYVPALADLYGVSRDDLLVAQERSFGVLSSAPSETELAPKTLGQKITHLLRRRPLSDQQIADAINRQAAFDAVDAASVEVLRTDGAEAEQIRAGLPPDSLYHGLGDAFGVTPFFFAPGEEIERQVLERLEFLNLLRSDGVSLAARGASRGVSSEMLATLSEVLLRHEDEKGKPAS